LPIEWKEWKDQVMRKSSNVGVVLACLVAGLLFYACGDNEGNSDDTKLLSVVAISRHGIRSQLSPLESTTPNTLSTNLDTLRPQGFPLWPGPAATPGNLSTVGQQNATRLGAWYRDFYAAQGLLPPRGSCPAAGTVFVYADVYERTIHTAQGYVDGMFQAEATPDCGVQVIHAGAQVQADPYIATAFALLNTPQCKIVTAVDHAAFNTAIGGNTSSLITKYSTQLQTLQTVTQCCQPAACNQSSPPASCSLLDLPTEVSVDPTTGVSLNPTGAVAYAAGSLFDVADSVTSDFELQYAQGMPQTDCATTQGAQCVGWGAIPQGGLSDLTKLHVLNIDLTCRLPSFAQVASTNLMWQLVGTMDQTLTGVENPDMLAPAASKFTLFVAHDQNQSAIGAFLGGVTWKAEGFQQNDPGPAGALVFELHKVKQSGQPIVRLFYVIATLDQMRNGTALSLQTPPQRIPLAIPACGGVLDCPYDQFKTFITGHVRQDCIVTPASAP
ncbi:MAG TPA: histidine-type phosphatase, partial [Candidatus Binatia bacterium]